MSEIVKVVWLDSTCLVGWRGIDEAKAESCVYATNWGQIIHENEERIVLAHQAVENGDPYNAMLIPHVQIISIETYEIPDG